MRRLSIGLVQGRLSRQIGDFVQNFPKFSWENEFYLAQHNQIPHIEWILTEETLDNNPLFTEPTTSLPRFGRTNVRISGVCLDAMNSDKFKDPNYREKVLLRGLQLANKDLPTLMIGHVVIPLLEKSSIKDKELMKKVAEQINTYSEWYPAVKITLEADLDITDLQQLLEMVPQAYVTFDTGNLTRLGYNLRQHIDAYKDKIVNVHIKDVDAAGASVKIGAGITDFSVMKELLTDCKNLYYMTFQAARVPEVPELQQYEDNYKFMEDLCQNLFKKDSDATEKSP